MKKEKNLSYYKDVAEHWRVDGVSPKDIREVWKEAQKELLAELIEECDFIDNIEYLSKDYLEIALKQLDIKLKKTNGR